MKRILIGVVSLMVMFCVVGCSGITSENVTGIVETENMVYFEPQCPDCQHIGYTKSENVCEGEEYNGIHQCEKCGDFFDIEVKR